MPIPDDLPGAAEATGDEYARLWRMLTTIWPGYDAYRERAGGRDLPVFVLSPR